MIGIFDLDNCLSNDEWRLCRIKVPKELSGPALMECFTDYHDYCLQDEVHHQQEVLAYEHVIFATSRPESVRDLTERWLSRHFPDLSYCLLMRPMTNYMPCSQLKVTLLANHWGGSIPLAVAYDDQPETLRAYQSELGLEVRHLYVNLRS